MIALAVVALVLLFIGNTIVKNYFGALKDKKGEIAALQKRMIDIRKAKELAKANQKRWMEIGGQTFSMDPNEVRRCARIFGDAARAAGLGLCVKHFPGLGGARTDSHLALTDLSGLVSPAQERLFTELAAELPGGAALLSHGFVREWDAERPASISPAAVARFRAANAGALLITDDVQMQGLQGAAGTVGAALRALDAGIDLVCIGNNLLAQADECIEAARSARARTERDAAFAAKLAASRVRIAARKSFAAG
jgi:beta-N-acetylhexosaminidase